MRQLRNLNVLFFLFLSFTCLEGFSQKNVLYGGVYSEGKVPIAGATVSLSKSIGTVTDENGLFTLRIPKNKPAQLTPGLDGEGARQDLDSIGLPQQTLDD